MKQSIGFGQDKQTGGKKFKNQRLAISTLEIP